jgi:hypothetical protein
MYLLVFSDSRSIRPELSINSSPGVNITLEDQVTLSMSISYNTLARFFQYFQIWRGTCLRVSIGTTRRVDYHFFVGNMTTNVDAGMSIRGS